MRVFYTSSAANDAGGVAGDVVTVDVVLLSGDGTTPKLPSTTYQVLCQPDQANIFATVSSKTVSGFTITLTPLSTYQIAAGTVAYVICDGGSPIG